MYSPHGFCLACRRAYGETGLPKTSSHERLRRLAELAPGDIVPLGWCACIEGGAPIVPGEIPLGNITSWQTAQDEPENGDGRLYDVHLLTGPVFALKIAGPDHGQHLLAAIEIDGWAPHLLIFRDPDLHGEDFVAAVKSDGRDVLVQFQHGTDQILEIGEDLVPRPTTPDRWDTLGRPHDTCRATLRSED